MHDILQKIYLQKSVILVIRLLGTAESADPDNTIIEHSLSQVIWLFGYLVLGCFRCKHSLCGCTASHPRTRMFRRLVWPLLGSAAPQASLCVH